MLKRQIYLLTGLIAFTMFCYFTLIEIPNYYRRENKRLTDSFSNKKPDTIVKIVTDSYRVEIKKDSVIYTSSPPLKHYNNNCVDTISLLSTRQSVLMEKIAEFLSQNNYCFCTADYTLYPEVPTIYYNGYWGRNCEKEAAILQRELQKINMKFEIRPTGDIDYSCGCVGIAVPGFKQKI